MTTRAEHLAWCKERAIDALDGGDMHAAVMSMISDLGKWEKPLYDQSTLAMISTEGLMFCNTPQQVKHWIEGFN